MSGSLVAAFSLFLFFLAYRYYSRFLAEKIFLLFMTIWAMVDHVFFEWSGWGEAEPDWLLFVFGSVILGFAIWIILEAVRLMRRFEREEVEP